MGQYELHVNGQDVDRGDSFDYPGEGQYSAYRHHRRGRQAGAAARARRALPLLDLHLPGPRQRPGSNTTLAGRAGRRRDEPQGRERRRLRRRATRSRSDRHGAGGRHGHRDRHRRRGRHRRHGQPRAHAGARQSGARPSSTSPARPGCIDQGRRRPRRRHAATTFVTDGTWKVTKADAVHERDDHAPQRRLRRQRRALRRARSRSPAGTRPASTTRRGRPPTRSARTRGRSTRCATTVQPPRPGDLPRSTTRRCTPSVGHDARRRHAWSPTSARCSRRVPQIAFKNGVAGRALVMQTSYRLNNTTLSPPRPRRATRRSRSPRVANFAAGDKITVDQARRRLRRRRSRDPHDHRGRHRRRDGHRHHARRAAQPRARQRRATSRARAPAPSTHDTQGSNMRWWYTQKDGAQTAQRVHSTGAGATCRSCRPARARR